MGLRRFIRTHRRRLSGNLSWINAKRDAKKNKKAAKEGILLVPPTDLSGSFGDDLMVYSFIANFSPLKKITVFSDQKIIRQDLLKYLNQPISYKGGFSDTNYARMTEVLKNCEGLVIIGADVLDGTYGEIGQTLKFFRLAQLACYGNTPVNFAGFSLSKKIHPQIKKYMRKLSSHYLFKARDRDTYDRLTNFIRSPRILQTTDLAFLCPDTPAAYSGTRYEQFLKWQQETQQQGYRIIAVCPNAIQAYKTGAGIYIQSFKTLIQAFLRKGKYALLFLYHDTRKIYGTISDIQLSSKLYNILKDEVPVYFDPEIKNGLELKGYLKEISFTLTGRMHFGISGLCKGKPMFGICYANKFEGMLKLFKVTPDDCLVDYTKMSDTGVVDRFCDNYIHIRGKIQENLPHVLRLAGLNSRFV